MMQILNRTNKQWPQDPEGIRTLDGTSAGFSSRLMSSDRQLWEMVRDIPGVRSWRILREIAFLATSLPMALAAFVIMVAGFTLGVSLSWLLIGFPILVWTVGLTLRLASSERDRIHVLLDEDLGLPRYPRNNGENFLRHLVTITRSPQVRSDLVYMLVLFPVAIIELAIVWLPFEFFFAPLMHMAVGSLSPFDVLWFEIGSRFQAMGFLALGAVLLLPMLYLMSLATKLHIAFARTLLSPR